MKSSRFAALIGLVVTTACGSPHSSAPAVTQAAVAPANVPLDPGGRGSLEARTPTGDLGAVELRKVVVRAEQAGDLAMVTVEHQFQSLAQVPLEGTFRFPMPEGALMTGLSMLVDGKVVEGELVERSKARRIFEEIVDAMQDPALLEWEHGTTFKMRVFPIEPQTRKVVTLRYLVPLRITANGASFAQGTRALDGSAKTPELVVEWNGKTVFSETQVATGRTIEIPAAKPSDTLREDRKDLTFAAVRFTPDWSKVPADTRPIPDHWIIVTDTSRSALEERKLTREALQTILRELPAKSQILMMTSDLETQTQPGGFVPVSPAAIDAALRFVDQRSSDGATDLSTLLKTAGKEAKSAGNAGVIYLGDCEPSWGETNPEKLVEEANRSLGKTPFNTVILGSSVDGDLARALAFATGGHAQRARQPEDIRHFTKKLSQNMKRLAQLEVKPIPDVIPLLGNRSALEEGEEAVILLKAPLGKLPPTLTLTGQAGGRPIHFVRNLQPTPSPWVAPRFGAEWIRDLERKKAPKDTIVEASLHYGVMSKHTSFLVLESEEAYAKYAIERRAQARLAPAPTADTPQVVGANLQTLGNGDTTISTDRIQPGDPEIFVDAPRDAERVEIRFPFGETKLASYDPEALSGRGAWFVRFLVDRSTPEGTYDAMAHIVFHDGRAEDRKVSYTVDRTPPTLRIQIHPSRSRPGMMEVNVTQAAETEDRDLRRVEIRTPDGETVELTAIRWAEFRGFIRVSPALTPGRLRVVGFDQALNHVVTEVELP